MGTTDENGKWIEQAVFGPGSVAVALQTNLLGDVLRVFMDSDGDGNAENLFGDVDGDGKFDAIDAPNAPSLAKYNLNEAAELIAAVSTTGTENWERAWPTVEKYQAMGFSLPAQYEVPWGSTPRDE